MTAYSSTCAECGQLCDWVDSLNSHGQWMHRRLPDDHRPQIDWQPMERLNDSGEWEAV